VKEEVEASGQVITFYSYKGGTGRSMALANVACLLAQRQTGSVLMVDWDLEAPGLHRYFRERFKVELVGADLDRALDERPGLIDLFLELDRTTRDMQPGDEAQSEESAREMLRGLDLQRFVVRTDIPSLHLLKAGRFSEEYAPRVNSFDWVGLYQRSPWLIRALSERLTAEYRYVLIDSRTGLTDISGICTMLMPERLVVVFTPNRQSLTGVLELIRRATKYRRQSDDLRPLIIFPLPSRIDDARPSLRDLWRFGDREREIPGFEALFEEAFQEVYDLAECELGRYFDDVQVYHVPDYAYGEEIAVLVERGSDRRSLSRSFESFTNTLVDRAGPWEDSEAVEAQSAVDEQSRAAEAAFARLTPEEQDVARQVFTSLVLLARPGEGGEDTRRRARMSELGPASAPVVNALAAARLVTVSREAGAEEETVEVTSEALVRNWTRLRQWLDDDRNFLLARQELRIAAAEWERNRQNDDFLLRSARLKEAERWLLERNPVLSRAEHLFLLKSATLQRRYKIRWRLAAAVFCLLAGLFAVFLYRYQEQSKATLASQLAARALSQPDSQQDLALLLSLESIRLNDTFEARSSLLKALQTSAVPRIRASLAGSTSAVGSVAFSPDGSTVAASNEAGRILVWNSANGNLIVSLPGRQKGIDSIAFSPDGETLAWGGQDGVVLGTAGTQPRVRPFPRLHQKEVDSVAFSPDGTVLASGSDDRTIILWNVAKGQPIHSPLIGHSGEVDSVAFSRDGRLLASGSEDGRVVLWDAKTGVALIRLRGDGSGIDGVAFSPDGELLAAGTDNGALLLLSTSTGERFASLRDQGDDINCVAFSPDGSILASGSHDGSILLWNVAARAQQGPALTGHSSTVQSLAFSPDGKTLASSSDDQKVLLWDIASAPSLGRRLPGPETSSVAFRPDGKLLTLTTGDMVDTIVLRDVATGKALDRPADLPVRVRSVALSPDGKLLAASSGTQILLWDPASRRLLDDPFIGHQRAVFGVAFSPDGKLLASSGDDKEIRLWDVASRRLFRTITHPHEVFGLAFSPDGKTLASGDYAGSIHLWDVASWQNSGVLTRHQAPVWSLSFSPDGRLLASSDVAGNIFLWDPKAAQFLGELLNFRGLRGVFGGVAFSPDGKTLASGNPLTLWDVDFDSWQARACRLAQRNLTLEEWKREIGNEPYHQTCPNLAGPKKAS